MVVVSTETMRSTGSIPGAIDNASARWSRVAPIRSRCARFASCQSGATAIEYGLIVALIGTAIVVAVGTVGSNLTTLFEDIAAGFE